MDLDKIRTSLTPWIQQAHPKLILVFGSSVTGLPGPSTDLDLGIWFGKEVNILKTLSELTKALERDDLDLMVLDSADPIARKAASEGKVIYEDVPGRSDAFWSLAHRQFMDTAFIRKARKELIQDFVSNWTA